MRTKGISVLFFVMILILVSCGKTAVAEVSWQEQYDLGVRYLSEGSYEEAILAFTAAIEIDPKQAPAYVGLADAHLGKGNLNEARETLEHALELVDDRESIEEKLLGLANILVENVDGHTNSSGGTLFSLREGFVAYTDLSNDEQHFISDIAEAVIKGDKESLLSAAQLGESIVENHVVTKALGDICLYTYWGGYKIGLAIKDMGNFQDDAFSESYWSIELRPENGTGYYATVLDATLKDGYDLPSTAAGYISMQDTVITQCNCSDWKWNGDYYSEELSNTYQLIDGQYRRGTNVTVEQGAMLESLRNGEFVRNWTYSYDYGDPNYNTSGENSRTVIYENGELVDGGINFGKHTIDDWGYGWELTDQAFIDRLYW